MAETLMAGLYLTVGVLLAMGRVALDPAVERLAAQGVMWTLGDGPARTPVLFLAWIACWPLALPFAIAQAARVPVLRRVARLREIDALVEDDDRETRITRLQRAAEEQRLALLLASYTDNSKEREVWERRKRVVAAQGRDHLQHMIRCANTAYPEIATDPKYPEPLDWKPRWADDDLPPEPTRGRY